MEIEFAQSARKHRIGRRHTLEVIANYLPIEIKTLGKTKLRWIGKDNRGLELEVIGVLEKEKLIIIHVMPSQFRGSNKSE